MIMRNSLKYVKEYGLKFALPAWIIGTLTVCETLPTVIHVLLILLACVSLWEWISTIFKLVNKVEENPNKSKFLFINNESDSKIKNEMMHKGLHEFFMGNRMIQKVLMIILDEEVLDKYGKDKSLLRKISSGVLVSVMNGNGTIVSENLSPDVMNRQPFGFILSETNVGLVERFNKLHASWVGVIDHGFDTLSGEEKNIFLDVFKRSYVKIVNAKYHMDKITYTEMSYFELKSRILKETGDRVYESNVG